VFGTLGTVVIAVRGAPLGDAFSAMGLVPMFMSGAPGAGAGVARSIGVIALGEGWRGDEKSEKTQRGEAHFALRFTGARGAGCVSWKTVAAAAAGRCEGIFMACRSDIVPPDFNR
jgi:hypothetical protein